MNKIAGLYKELESDENIIFEGKTTCPTVFIKEAEIKKLIGRERKEVPISIAVSKVYLTNKRLLFLILFQLETKVLTDKGAPRFSGITGSWFEMPISAIQEVDIRPTFIKEDKEMMRLIEWGIVPSLSDRSPALEMIYDERMAVGRLKDYMESMLKMGFFTKLFKKIEKVFDKIIIIGEEITTVMPRLKNMISKRQQQ